MMPVRSGVPSCYVQCCKVPQRINHDQTLRVEVPSANAVRDFLLYSTVRLKIHVLGAG